MTTYRIGDDWTIERVGTPTHGRWLVTHHPTGLTARNSSALSTIRAHIKSGHLLDRMRRDHDSALRRAAGDTRIHYTEPATGERHIYSGRIGDWSCELHGGRTCNPVPRVTADQVLTLAARDRELSDNAFIAIANAAEE